MTTPTPPTPDPDRLRERSKDYVPDPTRFIDWDDDAIEVVKRARR